MATITREGFGRTRETLPNDGADRQAPVDHANRNGNGDTSAEGLGTQPVDARESESVSKVIMVNGRKFKTLAEAMRFMSMN